MKNLNRAIIFLAAFSLSNQIAIAGRYYDATTGRFLTRDKLAQKYPSWSPYVYVLDNPLKYVDPDGEEPVKSGVGSARGAANVLRNVPLNAERTLLLALNNNTNPFLATREGQQNRYIPTSDGKFIDMLHFTKAAAEVYSRSPKGDGLLDKAGKGLMMIGVQLGGISVEAEQALSGDPNIRHSAGSSEDIPSNFLGANFGAFFDPNKPLFGQVLQYLLDAGAITKDEYQKLYKDEYDKLPKDETEARERYKKESEENEKK